MHESKNYTHPNTHGEVLRVGAPKPQTKKEDTETVKKGKIKHYDLYRTADYSFLNDSWDNQSTFCLGYIQGSIDAKIEMAKRFDEMELQLKEVRLQRDALSKELDKHDQPQTDY